MSLHLSTAETAAQTCSTKPEIPSPQYFFTTLTVCCYNKRKHDDFHISLISYFSFSQARFPPTTQTVTFFCPRAANTPLCMLLHLYGMHVCARLHRSICVCLFCGRMWSALVEVNQRNPRVQTPSLLSTRPCFSASASLRSLVLSPPLSFSAAPPVHHSHCRLFAVGQFSFGFACHCGSLKFGHCFPVRV